MNPIQSIIQNLTKGMDFLQIYNAVKVSKNPKQLVISTMEKYGGDNPMVQNLIGFAKDDDAESIEKFARNICKENGVDYDTEFDNFCKKLGIKK